MEAPEKALRFTKMHVNGDDFVVIDARGRTDPLTSDIAKRLGNRTRGVGFNQLAVMADCDDAASRLTFWNSNGTRLKSCGSATCGVADIIMRETNSCHVTLRSDQGILICERERDSLMTVDMGAPLLGWREIPLARECDTLHLPIDGDPVACSMGNPHCTFFFDDLESIDLQTLGPAIETNALFPERTNVHFVRIIDRSSIRLRIWERGGGVPEGSGSCSCGAAVAAIRRNLTDRRVTVICDGGSVQVDWRGEGVKFTGSVETIFYGELPFSLFGVFK